MLAGILSPALDRSKLAKRTSAARTAASPNSAADNRGGGKKQMSQCIAGAEGA